MQANGYVKIDINGNDAERIGNAMKVLEEISEAFKKYGGHTSEQERILDECACLLANVLNDEVF